MAAVLLGGLAARAEARTPCDALDQISETLLVVRGIQTAPSDHLKPSQIALLEARVDGLSLAPLYEDHGAGDFRVKHAVVELYVYDLQRAVAMYHSGDTESAQSILANAVPPAVGASLAQLQRIQSCGPISNSADFDFSSQAGGQVGYAGENQDPNGGDRVQPGKANLAQQSSGPKRANAAHSSSNLGQTGNGGVVVGLFVILALLLAVLLIRRKRKPRPREQRRICHQDVEVLVGRRRTMLTIVDFSSRGMKVRHDGEIRRRRVIRFKFDRTFIKGKVRWHNDAYAGIRFTNTLAKEHYDFIVGRMRTIDPYLENTAGY